MDVSKTINQIKEIAERNCRRESSQKTRMITEDKIAVGECFRQGDLYVFRVGRAHPVGVPIERNQLADGVSIGARHILNGNFTLYRGIQKPDCLADMYARIGTGYAFDAEATTVLGHPEHDNYVFKFSDRWQVVHQIDLRTLLRVQD